MTDVTDVMDVTGTISLELTFDEDRSRLELKGLEAANAAESAALPGQLQVLPAKSPARAQG